MGLGGGKSEVELVERLLLKRKSVVFFIVKSVKLIDFFTVAVDASRTNGESSCGTSRVTRKSVNELKRI